MTTPQDVIAKLPLQFFDVHQTDVLTGDQKVELVNLLFDELEKKNSPKERIIECIGHVLPKIPAPSRFTVTKQLCESIISHEFFSGPDTFRSVDHTVLDSLADNERGEIAELFHKGLKKNHVHLCEASLWGLSQTLPHLHGLYQKSYAYDMLRLADDRFLLERVIDALSKTIFNLSRQHRTDMAYFFAEMLKKNETSERKKTIISILTQITPSISDQDRLLIADCVAPIVFHTDLGLVHKALHYFTSSFSLIPSNQRFCYSLMISGLLHDASLHDAVQETLQVALPFLTDPDEKDQIRVLLEQDRQEEHAAQRRAEDEVEEPERRLFAVPRYTG